MYKPFIGVSRIRKLNIIVATILSLPCFYLLLDPESRPYTYVILTLIWVVTFCVHYLKGSTILYYAIVVMSLGLGEWSMKGWGYEEALSPIMPFEPLPGYLGLVVLMLSVLAYKKFIARLFYAIAGYSLFFVTPLNWICASILLFLGVRAHRDGLGAIELKELFKLPKGRKMENNSIAQRSDNIPALIFINRILMFTYWVLLAFVVTVFFPSNVLGVGMTAGFSLALYAMIGGMTDKFQYMQERAFDRLFPHAGHLGDSINRSKEYALYCTMPTRVICGFALHLFLLIGAFNGIIALVLLFFGILMMHNRPPFDRSQEWTDENIDRKRRYLDDLERSQGIDG